MKARRSHKQQKLARHSRLACVKGAADKQWDESAFHCYLLRMGIQNAVDCLDTSKYRPNETTQLVTV